MAELFATSKQNVSLHIKNALKDKELDADSVVKDYLTTAATARNTQSNYIHLVTDLPTQTTSPDSSISR